LPRAIAALRRRETASNPDRLYAGEGDWPFPAATALRQSLTRVLAEVIASLQTLTWRSSVSVDGGVAPHHRSPTSAMEPAGQDLGARMRSGLATLPLRSRPNASPFWIMLLLSSMAFRHGMIDADRTSCRRHTSCLLTRQDFGTSRFKRQYSKSSRFHEP